MPGDGGDERAIALRLAQGAALATLALVLLVSVRQGGPDWFVHFGRLKSEVTPYAREVVGDVHTPVDDGTDGQAFWIQARDPLLVHPEVFEEHLIRPVYRTQRVLYPLLASPWRLAGEQALFWGLLLTNVALVGLGTFWATRLAQRVGAPARAGLAFVLNPGVLAALYLDCSDVLAVALTVGGVLAYHRRRWGWAAAAFAGAALSKEVMLLVPAVLFLATVRRRPKAAFTFAVPAGLAVLAWGAYVRARLSTTETSVHEFATPFYGFLDAWQRSWQPFHDWGNALTAAVMLAALVGGVVLWLTDRTDQVALAAVPFAVLFVFLSAQVLALPTNSLRAAAPAITFIAIAGYRRLNPATATPAVG